MRTGSTVALAVQGWHRIAYAADEDDRSIVVVDVDGRRQLGEVPLEGKPSQLMFLGDGRLAVLLRDRGRVAVLEPGVKPEALEARCSVETAAEPVGLALTPDGATLLVTSGWGRALVAFDGKTLARSYEVALAREPRAVVVSDDGRYAYVSHAVGAQATRVTLADRTVKAIPLREFDGQADQEETDGKDDGTPASHPSCQGFALAKLPASAGPAGRILAPQVLVDNGDPSQRAPGYGTDDSGTEAGDVAVIDEATGKPIAASLERQQDFGWGNVDARDTQRSECLLPRAAAVDGATHSLLVTCFGIDQLVVYDALAASPVRAERRRWPVGAGPSGVAVDEESHRAVVWS
ncbi:MAG: YncE family protein, partial [Polyangiaceae bacterium]